MFNSLLPTEAFHTIKYKLFIIGLKKESDINYRFILKLLMLTFPKIERQVL